MDIKERAFNDIKENINPYIAKNLIVQIFSTYDNKREFYYEILYDNKREIKNIKTKITNKVIQILNNFLSAYPFVSAEFLENLNIYKNIFMQSISDYFETFMNPGNHIYPSKIIRFQYLFQYVLSIYDFLIENLFFCIKEYYL